MKHFRDSSDEEEKKSYVSGLHIKKSSQQFSFTNFKKYCAKFLIAIVLVAIQYQLIIFAKENALKFVNPVLLDLIMASGSSEQGSESHSDSDNLQESQEFNNINSEEGIASSEQVDFFSSIKDNEEKYEPSPMAIQQFTSTKVHIINQNKDTKENNKYIDPWNSLKIIQAQNDKKVYQFHKLQNELKVLLISDPDRINSVTALDVHIGGWNDPIEGLSHFLEHMTFQSTSKQKPTPIIFDTIVYGNSGAINAYTSQENTNYYFSISPSRLEESLFYFAGMFINISFEKERVLQEVNAVNSEHVNSLQKDENKFYYLIQTISKKDHPYSKFLCGSTETLLNDKIDILEELYKYQQTFYSSHIMTLVIASPHSIKELETLVQKSNFQDIPRRDFDLTFEDKLSLPKSAKKKIYKIKSSNPISPVILHLYLQILKKDHENRIDLFDYLSALFVKNSKGGFKYQMFEKKYINSLEPISLAVEEGFLEVFVQASLTVKGYQNLDEILISYFKFIRQVKKDISQDNFKRKGDLNMMLFEYDGTNNIVVDQIRETAKMVNKLDKPEEVNIQGQYKEFDPKVFQSIFEKLENPSLYIIAIQSPTFDKSIEINSKILNNIDDTFSQRNEIFNLDYQVAAKMNKDYLNFLKSDDSTQQSFKIELELDLTPKGEIQIYNPEEDNVNEIKFNSFSFDMSKPYDFGNQDFSSDPYKNQEISKLNKYAFTKDTFNFKLKQTSSYIRHIPFMIEQTISSQSFLLMDQNMLYPKVKAKIRLFNKNVMFMNIEQIIEARIITQAQQKYLQEQFAQAFESDFQISFSSSNSALMILEISGWRENYLDVFNDIIEITKKHQITQNEWQSAKDVIDKQVKERVSEYTTINILSKDYAAPLLNLQAYSSREELEAIQNAEYQEKENLFNGNQIDIMIGGNISPQESINLTEVIDKLFPREKYQETIREYQVLDISGHSFIFQQYSF